jgi:hypothetical protein
MDQFQTEKVEDMNRATRRSKLKFFKATLVKHVAKKPLIPVDITNDDTSAIDKMRAWAVNYAILNRKIDELS